jgi:hypothetical protein
MLLIEKMPCGACDALDKTANVSAMLPPNSRLTVVDPEAADTYWSTR